MISELRCVFTNRSFRPAYQTVRCIIGSARPARFARSACSVKIELEPFGTGTLLMIIDCHGHYTTAPKALEDWRNAQIAGINDSAKKPSPSSLKISDDELRHSIETNQLKFMRERGSDLTIFSPRASFMAHHIGDFEVSSPWGAICNEMIFRVTKLFPENFIGAAMLPQSPGVDPRTCIPELEKCVKEYGFVGINPKHAPSSRQWTAPPQSARQ